MEKYVLDFIDILLKPCTMMKTRYRFHRNCHRHRNIRFSQLCDIMHMVVFILSITGQRSPDGNQVRVGLKYHRRRHDVASAA